MDLLDEEDYSFREEGNKIVIDHDSDIYLSDLTSIPPDILFQNDGSVDLPGVLSIPKGIEFDNKIDVVLSGTLSLSPGTKFRNRRDLFLDSLQSIGKGIIFKNRGEIRLYSVSRIGEGTIFSNGKELYFTGGKIPDFSKGVRFENNGAIYFNEDSFNPEFFIEGIRRKEILNCLIKQIYG
jgi:hypothetical protein